MHKHINHMYAATMAAMLMACDPSQDSGEYGDTDDEVPQIDPGLTPCDAIAVRENKVVFSEVPARLPPDADVVGPPVFWGGCGYPYGFFTWCVPPIEGLSALEGALRISMTSPHGFLVDEDVGKELHLWTIADGPGRFERSVPVGSEVGTTRPWAPIADVGGKWRLVATRWGTLPSQMVWALQGSRWGMAPEPGTAVLGEISPGHGNDASTKGHPVGGAWYDDMISVVSSDGSLGWTAIRGACLLEERHDDGSLDGTGG